MRHEGATEIFHCPFDEDWDVNYDAWPDRWKREQGKDFPHYVDVDIRKEEGATGSRSLHFALDGAGASVSSPPIRILPKFMYKLEARVRTQDIRDTEIRVTVDFYDDKDKLCDSYSSDPIRTQGDWATINVGPISLTNDRIDRATFRFEAVAGSLGDLAGKVWLDDVWFARLPRMTVRTNSPFNVYSNKDDVVIICELSGIQERDPEIRYQLLDEMSRPLNGEGGDSLRLDGRLIVEDTQKVSDIVDGVGNRPAGYEGATTWKPPLPDYGYYRIAVRMLSCDPSCSDTDDQREMYRREITIAVVPPLTAPTEGEFGWTLPTADKPHSFGDLTRLLPRVGLNRVKIPAWYDPNDERRGDEIVQFAELLDASNIDVVGMLVEPPPGSDASEHFDSTQSIANLFLNVDPDYWQPSLDPVMTRLALRVRWWQLGGDRDHGFADTIDLAKRVSELQPLMFRFGQDVNLGFGWPWNGERPPTGRVPWEFETFSSGDHLTTAQLADALAAPDENTAQRWVLIDPIDQGVGDQVPPEEDVKRRVRALLRQIVAAKVHAAAAIIYPDPFSDQHGLMRSDGSPGELLMPWRTAASMLSTAEYLGRMQLPCGSENRVFLRRDGKVVMVVWNDEAVREKLYLGDDVRQIDCWGRESTPARDGHRHVIDVGFFPSYVIGLNEAVTRWRMAVKFDSTDIPSVFRFAHPNRLQIKNTFRQGIGAKYEIVVPHKQGSGDADGDLPLASRLLTTWSISPRQGKLTLPTGGEFDSPLEIVLKDAPYGPQPVRVDFEVDADQLYKFSVYRNMHVGLGNIHFELSSHLEEDGTLVVEQSMTNVGSKLVDFNCYLYADGYRRQRAQIYRLGTEEHRKKYLYPNGKSLVGTELLLEAVEVEGSRILKYEFTVTE